MKQSRILRSLYQLNARSLSTSSAAEKWKALATKEIGKLKYRFYFNNSYIC